jgi:hypothetical protein
VSTLIRRRNAVEKPAAEPLCTAKELLVFAVICVVYAAVLFSLDPEWVAWAAPLAFGGALYTPSAAPASADLGPPGGLFQMAYFFDVVGLVALAFLGLAKGKAQFNWLAWWKAASENGNIARVRSYLRSVFTPTPGR